MKKQCVLLAAISIGGCSVSQDQEVAIGKQSADEVNSQLPIITEPAVATYIQTLGDSIAKTTSRADLTWHFYVVNTSQVNAFALPGGYVYVNRGLIETADRLDELTGTLGHEIGHVIQRHSVKQMQSQRKANAGLTIFCTLTAVCHSGLAQVAVSVGGSAYFAKHSRADELQADSEAVVNVLRAGFDPEGVPALFDALLKKRQSQPTIVEGWFASHPLEEERISRAKHLISALSPANSSQLVRDDAAFHDFKNQLSRLPVPAQQQLLTDTLAGRLR